MQLVFSTSSKLYEAEQSAKIVHSQEKTEFFVSKNDKKIYYL